jgi:hypothetical protein
MLIALPGVLVDGTTPAAFTPTRADVNVYQGQDTTVQVTVTGSSGNPISLAGYTATMTVRDRLLPVSGLPSISILYAGTLTTPAQGVVTFTIPGTDLKSLSLQSYFYDVFLRSTGGTRDEVVPTGLFTVNAAVGA